MDLYGASLDPSHTSAPFRSRTHPCSAANGVRLSTFHMWGPPELRLVSVDVDGRSLDLVVPARAAEDVRALNENPARARERDAGLAAAQDDLPLGRDDDAIVIGLDRHELLWRARRILSDASILDHANDNGTTDVAALEQQDHGRPNLRAQQPDRRPCPHDLVRQVWQADHERTIFYIKAMEPSGRGTVQRGNQLGRADRLAAQCIELVRRLLDDQHFEGAVQLVHLSAPVS